MKNNDVQHSNNAIRINRDNYRPRLNVSRFFRYILFVVLKGESPLETRPAYIKHRFRH
ncbi:MAG TPA: hypothetical protein PLQ32_03210 [Flavihumibacter sp.]|nr:hypothetical protein [Bacteroidota bacterium]HOA37763.1 hypothetical protein [Flavihumibacter sp.]HPZ87086.1 hypothetical protein [Flavihumibacter sp.]HQD09341.1 hypothetical protein [Flavihumibacter sp.]